MSSSITIGSTTVHMDAHGRFSLNDLHREAGGESRHQPALFLRQSNITELVHEIHSTNSQSAPVETINGGPERGTYVSRELVYAYAMWVSPKFHLTVIRAFDASATGNLPQAPEVPALPPSQIAARIHMDTAKALADLIPGLHVGIAASVALDAIHRDTGLTMEPYRALLPAATGPVASLNATAVGKALGISAQGANKLLAEKGFQRRSDKGGWEVTEAGARYGEMRPFTRNGHSDFQPLWREEVVQALR